MTSRPVLLLDKRCMREPIGIEACPLEVDTARQNQKGAP